MSKPSLAETFANKFIERLEAGVIPWQRPWTMTGNGPLRPMNMTTGKPYRGANLMILGMEEYVDPLWATFNQIRSLGGRVKKGSKATGVIFWKPLKIKEKNAVGDEVEKTIPLMRYYNVFNREQPSAATSGFRWGTSGMAWTTVTLIDVRRQVP